MLQIALVFIAFSLLRNVLRKNIGIGIKKDIIDFLHHICGPDVHCFCPPGEKIIFLMMHNCSANWIILMMSQLNKIVWLVKIDVDRSSDFLTHLKYTLTLYFLTTRTFDWFICCQMRDLIGYQETLSCRACIEKIFISHVINKQYLPSSVTLSENFAYII